MRQAKTIGSSFLSTLFLAAILAAPRASAADDAGSAAPTQAAPASSAAAPSGAAAAAGDDDDVGESKDEKPEHKEKRRSYIRRTKKVLDEAVHGNGKTLTDEERAVIRKHWHLSMRLWRIRHLAEMEKDKASVQEVDTLLAKTDAKTMAQLKELSAKAPGATAGTAGAK
jgi:hypothetical protein